jgi:predicted PurR-regulated permease PerM
MTSRPTWASSRAPDEGSGREETDRTSRDESRAASAEAHGTGASQIIVVFGVVAALWFGRIVLIPLVLSALLSFALEPFVARLESWRVPRPLGVPFVLGAVLCLCVGGVYGLRGEAAAFIERLPQGAHVVATTIQRATRGRPNTVSKVQQAAQELEKAASAATAGSARRQDGVTAVRIEEPAFRWSDWLWQGWQGAVELMAQSIVVFCLVYYLLIVGDLYKRKLVRMVPTLSERKVAVGILDEINRQIERFLVARAAISAIVGVAVWLSFRLVGVQDAGVWGVLSAVLYAIPFLGPTIVVIGSAIAAFVQFGTPEPTAVVAAISLAIGIIEGNVLTPWLMSRAGDMNAGAVFVSLMFWGWLWGIWGLLLAVPITASLKATWERIPEWEPWAELLKK